MRGLSLPDSCVPPTTVVFNATLWKKWLLALQIIDWTESFWRERPQRQTFTVYYQSSNTNGFSWPFSCPVFIKICLLWQLSCSSVSPISANIKTKRMSGFSKLYYNISTAACSCYHEIYLDGFTTLCHVPHKSMNLFYHFPRSKCINFPVWC